MRTLMYVKEKDSNMFRILFTKKQDDQYDENPPQYSYEYGAPPAGNYPNSDDYNTYRGCSS